MIISIICAHGAAERRDEATRLPVFPCMRMCLRFYMKCIAKGDERNIFMLRMAGKYVILIIIMRIFNLYNDKISKLGGFAADCRGIQMEQKKSMGRGRKSEESGIYVA